MTDHIRKQATDAAAYLAYKHAVTSVGAYPLPAAEFASPADVMRHIVLVVDSAKAMRATLGVSGSGERRWWWHK